MLRSMAPVCSGVVPSCKGDEIQTQIIGDRLAEYRRSLTLCHLVAAHVQRQADVMDIFFTTLGIVLVLAVWPALVVYAWNDSMLRSPRRRVVRTALARLVAGASGSTPGVPARR
jgi:hypothetical protein